MTDLTTTFGEAASRSQEWNESLAEAALRKCEASVAGSRSEWEEDEGWGMVTKSGEIISCISSVVPLAMINESYFDILCDSLAEYGLTIISFSDFYAKEYSIDPRVLEEVFGITISPDLSAFGKLPDPDRNFENMSLHDIWFHTV